MQNKLALKVILMEQYVVKHKQYEKDLQDKIDKLESEFHGKVDKINFRQYHLLKSSGKLVHSKQKVIETENSSVEHQEQEQSPKVARSFFHLQLSNQTSLSDSEQSPHEHDVFSFEKWKQISKMKIEPSTEEKVSRVSKWAKSKHLLSFRYAKREERTEDDESNEDSDHPVENDCCAHLTAFSRYNQEQHKPRAPQLEPKLKSKIRTKVVKNYLLQDVFKRLSKDQHDVFSSKGVSDTEEKGDRVGHSVRYSDLKECRYLRLPHQLSSSEDDERTLPSVDIT